MVFSLHLKIVTLSFSCIFTGAEGPFVIVRNGDKITLPCRPLLPCSRIDWFFARGLFRKVPLVLNGTVFQPYIEEFGQHSVTSNCSLEIMETTEKLVGQFQCKRSDTYEELATFLLSVVSCE